MKHVRSRAAWLLVASLVLVLAACVPPTTRIVDRAVDRAVRHAVDAVVDRLVRRAVDRIVDRMFVSIYGQVFGDVTIRYGPDFDLDFYSGSYEVEVAGAAPVVGSFRGEPVSEDSDPEAHNVAFGLRGEDEDGARFVSVSLVQNERVQQEFAIVLVEADDSAEGEGGTVASIFFGDTDDEAYSGDLTWTLTTDSATRLVGSFEASGLMTESGLGPVDVRGTFDVPANRHGSLIIVRAER